MSPRADRAIELHRMAFELTSELHDEQERRKILAMVLTHVQDAQRHMGHAIEPDPEVRT